MAGSIFGKWFRISTWGESHGKAVGVVVDGCPAGLPLSEEDIQELLDRRRPGQGGLSTARSEEDRVEILSGVFEGQTTGTPISMIVFNRDQRSRDYSQLSEVYRPGHADFGFEEKYGIRDYRGGGRSSARETIARVAAGAVAIKILRELGVTVSAEAVEIGGHVLQEGEDPMTVALPELAAGDSVGGIVQCRATGVPCGIGETVFDKLDALLGRAMLSIGAVKGVEIGDGFAAARATGATNNDPFQAEDGKVVKTSNHAGGSLGGMSDGSELVLRVAFKPTPSISLPQETVNRDGERAMLTIGGRHDRCVVPRAIVVVEAMTALVLLDLMMENLCSRLDALKRFYAR